MPGAGAPAASCAHGVTRMHTSIHSEVAGTARHSRTQWFYGLYALFPEIGFLASVAGGFNSADLTPASRRQDHATSPSASVPFVIGPSASTASRLHVRDDRDTPLK
jgi:hypothetical protein